MSSSAYAMPPSGVEPAEHVRCLVESGRVAEARRYLASAPDDASLTGWREVLAPPVVRFLPTTSGSADTMRLNSLWLNAHADEHRGQWVALRGDQFVDCDGELDVLHRRLPDEATITLIKIPLV